jgi:hypothetical protein
MKVYVLGRGLSDWENDPESEIVGIYSTAELAWEAALEHAPRSGYVDAIELDGAPFTEQHVAKPS